MDIENIRNLVDEIFEKRPTKDVFEKCLIEIINEKNKIISNEGNRKLINEIDKVIECIQIYLSVTAK